ncbi:MAG: RibD family protein [Pseudomonadota bacterium]
MTTVLQNLPFKISTSDPAGKIRDAGRIVIGQLGQTLDGFIATPTGDSKYINSDCGLQHLHKLRGVVDGVIVGVGSVNSDNPQLTVRLCEGRNPAKIIIDPAGRVDVNADLFSDEASDKIIITGEETDHPAAGIADIIRLPAHNRYISPETIVSALAERGLEKILVEGGNKTLSGFMDAGVLDRLHLIVAPVLMGSGLPGLNLAPIDKLHEALRPEVTLYPLGRDLMFDCDLRMSAAE